MSHSSGSTQIIHESDLELKHLEFYVRNLITNVLYDIKLITVSQVHRASIFHYIPLLISMMIMYTAFNNI